MDDTTSTTSAANHFSLPGAGRAAAVLGTGVTYKAEPSETGGRLVCFEITVPPGRGIPPHRHSDEDEAFYVLAGRVVVEGDGRDGGAVGLETGGFFYGPRGRVHGFRCEGPELAKLLVFVTPGAGIGAMFAELADLTRRDGDGIDPAHVGAVCGRYGIAFTGA